MIKLQYKKSILRFATFDEMKEIMSEDNFAILLYNIARSNDGKIEFTNEKMDINSFLLQSFFEDVNLNKTLIKQKEISCTE